MSTATNAANLPRLVLLYLEAREESRRPKQTPEARQSAAVREAHAAQVLRAEALAELAAPTPTPADRMAAAFIAAGLCTVCGEPLADCVCNDEGRPL